jgi:hypothetical protein
VGATGTQVANIAIPSTSTYIGGAFTFVRNAGTANVTQIKISETGTVNANTNLSNLKLYYKTQATCATSSIPGDATAFNSTGVSFNGSEQATATGTMAVGTSQVCVYAQLNVSSSTVDGNTLYIQITNPSTDLTVSAGTVSPASVQAIGGTTTLTVPSIAVSATGTQVSYLSIPSTNQYVGGAFTFVRNAGTANVTQIVVSETGTENANQNLANVDIYYKTQATCATSSIPSDAALFNGAGVAFNSSEQATATGTMAVGTSQVCVYVQLDVGSGATDGDTFDLQITNPSTDVLVSAGAVSPATAITIDAWIQPQAMASSRIVDSSTCLLSSGSSESW